MKKIKVAIVDDSASVRTVLSSILNSDSSIEVISASIDPIFAIARFEKEWPDVIVLDIEMPRKDGITFLKEIMQLRPTPVVICSSLTEKNAKITIKAMEAGAVEILTKPKVGIRDFLNESSIMIIDAVKSAASVNVKNLKRRIKETKVKDKPKENLIPPKHNADVILTQSSKKVDGSNADSFIAIGASAGGTQTLEVILKDLPKSVPGIVIVQHMPEKFTKAFADRLNNVCKVFVKEAENGDKIEQGTALIAPGNFHMLVKRTGPQYSIQIKEGSLVNRHRPAVDVLFRSVANTAGSNVLGIILTGMGDDGAAGLLEMKMSGSHTIAQDEETCIVFGMPKEAINRGGVSKIMSLDNIPNAIVNFVSE